MKQSEVQLERQQQAEKIINQLKTCIAKVLEKYPVEMAYLHGSVARGQPLSTSDIDIALVLSNVPAPYQRLRLELDIQATLEDACGLSNIDIRTINHAPIMVQGPIIQTGKLLYSRNQKRRVAFEVLTRKKYFDFEPVAKTLQEAFFNRLRRKGFRRGQSKHDRNHPKQSR